MISSNQLKQNVILLHVDQNQRAGVSCLLELETLVLSVGFEPVFTIRFKRHTLTPKILIGSGQLEFVRFLLESRASMEAKDKQGCSPLRLAVKSHQLDVAELLLDKLGCLFLTVNAYDG